MSDEKARPREGEDIQGEIEGLMSGDAAPGVPPPDSAETEDRPEGAAPRDAGGFEPAIDAASGAGKDDASGAAPDARTGSGEASAETAPEAAPGEEAPPGGAPEEDVDRLSRSLEMLDQRVSLLIDRHADLLRNHRDAVEELDEKSARLERLRAGGEDPERLLERIRSLEAENDRLCEHAAFLEGRIESLLNRVRYVVES